MWFWTIVGMEKKMVRTLSQWWKTVLSVLWEWGKITHRMSKKYPTAGRMLGDHFWPWTSWVRSRLLINTARKNLLLFCCLRVSVNVTNDGGTWAQWWFLFFRFEMTDWVDKIREPLDLKRATSLKVQVKYIILYMILCCCVYYWRY